MQKNWLKQQVYFKWKSFRSGLLDCKSKSSREYGRCSRNPQNRKKAEQIVDYDKYLQWNRHNRLQIVWKVIQKFEEKKENIISSNLTRLQINTRDFTYFFKWKSRRKRRSKTKRLSHRILIAERFNEFFVNIIPN